MEGSMNVARVGMLSALLVLCLAAPRTSLAQGPASPKLASPAATTPPVKGTRYLYLIRHGIYDRDSTADDVAGNGINQMGREQAAYAGARLAHLPITITSLVSSHFKRAVETADVVGQILGLTPVRDTLLHECTPTTTRADVMKTMAPGEGAAADSQLTQAWAKYAQPGENGDEHWVLVAHGNVIRWFTCKALGVDTKQWGQLDIANASITTIAIRPDGTTRLSMFSDVGHIPLDKQTWTGKGAGWAVEKKMAGMK